jgi:hypothetical protein
MEPPRPKKLPDQVSEILRRKHYSPRTEERYSHTPRLRLARAATSRASPCRRATPAACRPGGCRARCPGLAPSR